MALDEAPAALETASFEAVPEPSFEPPFEPSFEPTPEPVAETDGPNEAVVEAQPAKKRAPGRGRKTTARKTGKVQDEVGVESPDVAAEAANPPRKTATRARRPRKAPAES